MSPPSHLLSSAHPKSPIIPSPPLSPSSADKSPICPMSPIPSLPSSSPLSIHCPPLLSSFYPLSSSPLLSLPSSADKSPSLLLSPSFLSSPLSPSFAYKSPFRPDLPLAPPPLSPPPSPLTSPPLCPCQPDAVVTSWCYGSPEGTWRQTRRCRTSILILGRGHVVLAV
uniref:Uncharacterized protein n=1 Tax=Knipowitschia caucasica TaxID=637954 RepID=A0AAV2KC38_KNICA